MRIEYLELRNFRLFRRDKWSKLSPFTVIVGANGSGKSTFFDASSFRPGVSDGERIAGRDTTRRPA